MELVSNDTLLFSIGVDVTKQGREPITEKPKTEQIKCTCIENKINDFITYK